MAKLYSIRFLIEDALAQAAVKRGVAGFQQLERAAQKAGKAMNATLSSAPSVGAGIGAVGGGGGVGRAGSGPVFGPSLPTIGVGLGSLQMSGLNLQTRVANNAKLSAAVQTRELARLDKIQDQYLRKDYARRVAFERRKIEDVKESADKQSAMYEKLALGSIGLAGAAASSLFGILESSNVAAQEQVDKLIATKDALREIVMIGGGKEGPTDPEVMKHLALRSASGLTAESARDFSLEFAGAGEITRGVNIPEAEYERLKPMLARFAATAGGGPGAAGTYGKLGGLLLGLGKYDKAEDLLATEVQFNKILSAGVGDNPTLIRQAAQVAGAYLDESEGGIVGSPVELAAMTATASRVSPTRAGQVMKSTTTALRGFGEQWAPLLKEAGIGEKDTDATAMAKMFDLIDKAKATGRAPDAYLNEKNLPEAKVTAILSMYKYRDIFDKSMAENAEPMTGAQAQAEIEQKFRVDPSLRIHQREAELEGVKLGNAMGNQHAREIQLQAEKRLEFRGEGEGGGAAAAEDWQVGLMNNPLTSDYQKLGRKIRVEQEMFRMAQERGQTVPGRPDDRGWLGGKSNAYVAWLESGGDLGAYSSVGFERELADRTTPGGMDALRPRRRMEEPEAGPAWLGFEGQVGGHMQAMIVAMGRLIGVLEDNTRATDKNTPKDPTRVGQAPAALPSRIPMQGAERP